MMIQPMVPYRGWLFFAADDTDEVNAEYEKLKAGDDTVLADPVTIVAVEYRQYTEMVWFVRRGRLERRDAWSVRGEPV